MAVAVNCGLGLGSMRRAAGVHGVGKRASVAGMRMAARRRSRNAEASRPGSVGSSSMPGRFFFRETGNVGRLRGAEEGFSNAPMPAQRIRCARGRSLSFLAAAPVRGCSARSANMRTMPGSSMRRSASCTGLQFETDQRVFEIGNAAAVEGIAEPVPGVLRRGAQLAPIEKDVALVGMELEGEAAVEQIVGAAEIFEAGERVAAGNDRRRIAAERRGPRGARCWRSWPEPLSA